MKHRIIALLLVLALAFGAASVQAYALEQESGETEPTAEEWPNQVWVSFFSNGGYGTIPEDMATAPGGTVILPDAELTVSVGGKMWYFVGWSSQPGDVYPEYLPQSPIAVQTDLELYAIFSLEKQEEPPQDPQEPLVANRRPLALNTRDHIKFMDGKPDGLFHPTDSVSRAEIAQILYNLLEVQPNSRLPFPDVPESAWYAAAVSSLVSLGVMSAGKDGAFEPERAMTRGEFAVILDNFLPAVESPLTFPDVGPSHPAREAIGRTAACGLFTGYADGNFYPDKVLSRAQTAVVLNKLLGRVPDESAIFSSPDVRIFPDVPADFWAYSQIMEATIAHNYTSPADGIEHWTWIQRETTALEDGMYPIGGYVYRVRDGVFLRSATADGYTFDSNGHCVGYATGSPALDERLRGIVDRLTTPSMGRDEKLRALYNYVRDNFTYLKRPLVEAGQTGWEPAYAEEFLNLGKGNCYSFAATYCLLTRQLGLPSYTVGGRLGRSASPHCWVEMELDGATYMFDPQLEWRYLHDYGRKGYNLFKMRPSAAPFIYAK